MFENKKNNSGQVATEFIAVVSMMIVLVLAMMMVIPSFADYCWRILSLVALDYP